MSAQDIHGRYETIKGSIERTALESAILLNRRTIVRGTVYNMLQFVFTGALLPIFITPLIFHRLGPAGYGLWALIFTLGSWFYFLDVGINMGVTKFSGQYAGAADRPMLQKLFCTVVYAYAGMAVLAGGISVLAAHPLLRVFSGSHSDPIDDTALVLVLGFHFLGGAIKCVSGILAGLQQIERTGKIAISIGFIQGAAIWNWSRVASPHAMMWLAAIYAGVAVLQCMVLILQVRNTKMGETSFPFSLKFEYVDFALFRTLAKFSAILYLTQLLANILISDRLYLGWIRAPLDQIAEYHLGALLVAKTAAFLSVFAVAIYPAAAAFDARQDARRLEELTLRSFRACSLAGYFLFVFLCVYADAIFRVWLNQHFPFAVRTTWLLAGWGMTGILGGLVAVATGMGHPKIHLKACLVSVGCMAVLYPLIIRPYGAMGLAAAITISFVIGSLVYIHLFRKKVIPLSILSLFSDGLFKPLGGAALSIVPLWYLLSRLNISTRLEYACVVIGGFCLSLFFYLIFSRFAGMIREEDMELLGVFRSDP